MMRASTDIDINAPDAAADFRRLSAAQRISAVEEWLGAGRSPRLLKQRLGISRFELSHYRRLARVLTADARHLLERNALSLGHARAIGRLDPKRQEAFARDIIQRRWSAHRAEQEASSALAGASAQPDAQYYDGLAEIISEQIGHPVKVTPDRHNKRAGAITITYADYACFDSILGRLRVRLPE